MSGVADLYRIDVDSLVLSVHVQPGAGRSAVVGRHGAALKIRVAAPPVDDRASAAAVTLLASSFDVAPAEVTLMTGGRSRLKRFRIKGAEAPELAERLERLLDAAADQPNPGAGPRSRRDGRPTSR